MSLRQAACTPVDAINMSQECVYETAKGGHKWVGLTDEERADWHSMGLVGVEIVAAHLKEKNT